MTHDEPAAGSVTCVPAGSGVKRTVPKAASTIEASKAIPAHDVPGGRSPMARSRTRRVGARRRAGVARQRAARRRQHDPGVGRHARGDGVAGVADDVRTARVRAVVLVAQRDRAAQTALADVDVRRERDRRRRDGRRLRERRRRQARQQREQPAQTRSRPAIQLPIQHAVAPLANTQALPPTTRRVPCCAVGVRDRPSGGVAELAERRDGPRRRPSAERTAAAASP